MTALAIGRLLKVMIWVAVAYCLRLAVLGLANDALAAVARATGKFGG